MSTRLFSRYIKRPYLAHLLQNSSEIQRNMSVSLAVLAELSLHSLLILIMESALIFAVVVLLFILDALSTVMACLERLQHNVNRI